LASGIVGRPRFFLTGAGKASLAFGGRPRRFFAGAGNGCLTIGLRGLVCFVAIP
jgi:hypothetical protein